jgi:hypothetical protein
MMTKFREDLDQLSCGREDCSHDNEHAQLRPGCHPEAGTKIAYIFTTGVIAVRCAACEKGVIEIAVAVKNGAGGKKLKFKKKEPEPEKIPVIQRMDQAGKKNRNRGK